ncbi:YetF domain-containing protein [Alkaliphilus peptidifermentans]|uniref:Uncharacterized membrane protein YcaP, DUF421 family n=1 Tax=Alkaliphilus peptidifermentans DSM 18978 TaxID=1120976 RepID=A0A1G5L8G7_9FIRM|nr:DUF421 domain-containing protein [Alkaliphilus peptidifermentans]SCZ09152.1 Uncharacterized membrane protein YcaP, DUF421 family [Alkaliphilus peptidifermentans DSM 18978]
MKVGMEIVLQTLLAFFVLLFLTRVLGRQQVSQLTMHEYVNGITFGSIAATLATDLNQRTWHHLMGLILFGILTFTASYLTMKSKIVSKVLQGEPVLVIQDGKILEKNLARFQYTLEDLNILLRKKDIFNIVDVKYGILEPTGDLSVLKVAQKESVKVEDLNITPKLADLPVEVIVTGSIIYENLRKKNLTAQWLIEQLRIAGVKDIKDVFYATLDVDDNLYIDRTQDMLSDKKDISESDDVKDT